MKRGISTTLVALILLVIVLGGVAGYGWLRPLGTQTTTVVQTLEDAAKAEGSLTIYGVTDTPDFVNFVQPLVHQAYPWMTINYLGLSPPEISSRISQEYQAGHVGADIASDTLGALESAILAGALANYTNPMLLFENFTTDKIDPQHRWQEMYNIPIVIMYNTELVNSSNVPTSWLNLTDAQWNGEVVLDQPKTLNVAGALFADLYPRLGNSSWTALMHGIANNNPQYTTSAGDSYDKVARGEAAVGVALLNDYIAGIHATPPVPVAIAFIEPLTTLPIVVGMTTNAPHPNCAKLFLQWYASIAGQLSTAATGRVPSQSIIAEATVLKGIIPEGKQIVTVAFNNLDYYENPSKWSDTYKAIFG